MNLDKKILELIANENLGELQTIYIAELVSITCLAFIVILIHILLKGTLLIGIEKLIRHTDTDWDDRLFDKGVFNKGENSQNSLDYNLTMTVPPKEAHAGTNKKISYEIDGTPEQLMIRIPEKFPHGGKLRIKGKGHLKDQKRGDLILQVKVTY